MNTFDNARTYFRAFIEKHFEDYWDKMNEYNSSSYGNYACKAELIQTAREIVHWLQDEFSDLEIGSKFVSPDHLVQTVEDLKKSCRREIAFLQRLVNIMPNKEKIFLCLLQKLRECAEKQ